MYVCVKPHTRPAEDRVCEKTCVKPHTRTAGDRVCTDQTIATRELFKLQPIFGIQDRLVNPTTNPSGIPKLHHTIWK